MVGVELHWGMWRYEHEILGWWPGGFWGDESGWIVLRIWLQSEMAGYV